MSGGMLKVDVTLANDAADWGNPQADQLIFIVSDGSKQDAISQQTLNNLKQSGAKVQETPITFAATTTASFETFLEAEKNWYLTVFLRQLDGNQKSYFEIPHNLLPFTATQIATQEWSVQEVQGQKAQVTAQFSSLQDFVELGDKQQCGFNNANYIKVQATGTRTEYDGQGGDIYGSRKYNAGHMTHPSQCVQFVEQYSSDIKAIEWLSNENSCKVYFSKDGMTKNQVTEIERDGRQATNSNCYMRKTVRSEITGSDITNTTLPATDFTNTNGFQQTHNVFEPGTFPTNTNGFQQTNNVFEPTSFLWDWG